MFRLLDITLIALSPLAAAVLGGLLFWIVAARGSDRNQRLTSALKALATVLMVTGICLTIVVNSHLMAGFLLLASVVIGIRAVVTYFNSERQSLLWALTIAAERGIPLESAALAFSQERNDMIGRRAKMLAEFLEAGVPLALALSRSRCSVTPAAQLAADLGQRTGTLGIGLRRATNALDEGESLLQSMMEKMFYLLLLLVYGTLIVTFVMVKITPVIAKMMDDFELDLPPTTTMLISVADTVASSWVVGLLVMGSIFVFILTVLCYVGVSPRQFPLINRLWWSADCSLVLHWLAIAIRQKLPIGEMVRLLATHFPQARVRRRLERASIRIDRGHDWQDSLRATGIFRHREAGIFKSAERAGNLAWALDEMAQRGIRRSAYRIRGWTNILFPLVLCGFGAIVLFICAGTFLPLISLIDGLSLQW